MSALGTQLPVDAIAVVDPSVATKLPKVSTGWPAVLVIVNSVVLSILVLSMSRSLAGEQACIVQSSNKYVDITMVFLILFKVIMFLPNWQARLLQLTIGKKPKW